MSAGTVEVLSTEYQVTIGVSFASAAERDAFIAKFPKSAKMLPMLAGHSAWFRAVIEANGVNGGRNETGIARARKALAILMESGLTVDFGRDLKNTDKTYEAVLARLA